MTTGVCWSSTNSLDACMFSWNSEDGIRTYKGFDTTIGTSVGSTGF